MAAVVASKPAAPPTKMKKPTVPFVQTSINGVKPTQSSSSPSTAAKRLPGQTPTPTTTTNGSNNVNGASRPSRRPPRPATRTNTIEAANMERRAARKIPDPYVPSESHILKKYRGKPPSLIVHLHPTGFRFDQQDGNFSYQSEMRLFIEHLTKKTIPHDMLEEFRKSDVTFYDGWLIVRIVDHKTVAKTAASASAISEDEQANSIHKHNPYITPSPYAPYSTKEPVTPNRSSPIKKDSGQSSSQPNGDSTEITTKAGKSGPRVFTVALRPTNLSRNTDLVLDSMMPDPKALNRRQSQAFVNSRTPASATMAAPPTPLSNVPGTPATEKGPPFKKQKLKIDPKDLLEYEARIINATAPPLYLDTVDTLEEVQCLLTLMKDPQHDFEPPSPKSRKRTVAELAADDAHAKGQERFMGIMEQRYATIANGGNGGIDNQGSNLFQPRFEKFIALDNIKKELAEKQKIEKERKIRLDEERQRQAQEDQRRIREDEQRRTELLQAQHAQAEREIRQRNQAGQVDPNRRPQPADLAKQQQLAQHLQQQQQRQAQQQQQNHQQGLPNGVPPNMRASQMIAQQSSPIIRQGSPLAKSSPIVGTGQMGHSVPMSATGSNPGAAGSPPRPGSALQHGHPGAAMTRGPSNQGPSRNGTPQISNSTPGMRNATPIMRQGTPSQRMSQASPHGSVIAQTPQMIQAGMAMAGQMQNGQQLNPQQIAAMNHRHALQQQQAALAAQGMSNGNPMSGQAHMAHMQAQRQAQMDQQNAMMLQHQQQQQQQQQIQQMAGTPQHPSQSPAMQHATQAQEMAYRQSVAKQMETQMRDMQNRQQGQGSPTAPQQPTPQQHHAAQLAHAQQQQQRQLAMQAAQQQGGQMPNGGQQTQLTPQQMHQRQIVNNPAFKQAMSKYFNGYMAQLMQKYGGNQQLIPREDMMQAQKMANTRAMQYVSSQQQQQQALQAQMRQNAQSQGHGQNMQAMMAAQQQQHHQQQQMQMQGGQPGQAVPNMQMSMAQAQMMTHLRQQQEQQALMVNQGQGMQQRQVQGQPGSVKPNANESQALYQQQLQHMLLQGGQR